MSSSLGGIGAVLIASSLTLFSSVLSSLSSLVSFLSSLQARILVCESQLKSIKWENEILEQRLMRLKKERDELYDKFTEALYTVQQKVRRSRCELILGTESMDGCGTMGRVQPFVVFVLPSPFTRPASSSSVSSSSSPSSSPSFIVADWDGVSVCRAGSGGCCWRRRSTPPGRRSRSAARTWPRCLPKRTSTRPCSDRSSGRWTRCWTRRTRRSANCSPSCSA